MPLSNSAYTQTIRLRLFQAASLIFVLAPAFGEYSVYFFTGRANGSLLSSLTMILATVLNYLYFQKSKNLNLALRLTSFVQLFCYCWGLLASKGIHAEHLVYMPLFPVINGFIFGKKGSIISTLFSAFFCVLLVAFEKFGITAMPTQIESAGLLGYQTIGATVFTGFIIVLFEEVRSNAERKLIASNEKALESERDVSFIVNSLGIGIWKWDLVTNELQWDENMYKLYGAEKSDFNGAYDAWENSLSSETKAKAVEEINAAVRGEKEFDTTFQVVQKQTGKIQEIRTRAFVIRDAGGKAIKMHGINIDRNREAELEKEMLHERAKSLHNAKLASLGEMSAGMAHEINNPAAIILGTVRMIPRFANDPEKLKEKVEVIEKATNRIAKIVGGLRKFSRSSDKANYQMHSLSKIIEESITLTTAKSRRHSTPVEVDCKTDGQVLCDEIEMEQILINLINNGIDAVKEKKEKWIRIKLYEERGQVVLQVRDSGPGISTEIQNKIFQPFFTTKPIGKGTGLGLSIVKGILDEHNATIEIKTQDPNTCFEIRFPKAEIGKLAA